MTTTSIDKQNITAVILAGGRGSRLGGKDKGLVEYQGRTMIEHIIRVIEPQVQAILINANRNEHVYRDYGYPVVNDELPDFQGPLAGFATAMAHAETSHILTLPCDGPCISSSYVPRMEDALKETTSQLAVAHDGVRIQPVHALISLQLRDDLIRCLAQGERKIDRWYMRHQITTVDFSDLRRIFDNINTMEQLRSLEKSNDE